MRNSQVTVKVPGTCGELVQGKLDDINFLVTCPVDIYTRVTALFSANPQAFPAGKWKAALALKKILRHFGQEKLHGGIGVSIDSDIPDGKGMASSTADITGVCLAVSSLMGILITPREIADIAVSIEPTDGIMFEGICLFDYLNGTVTEYIGSAPGINVFIIDTGGAVNTIEFNLADHDKTRTKNESSTREALGLVRKGILKRDASLIGRGATNSALCNQEILFKPELDKIIALGEDIGAFGVSVAHSGTVIGILLDPMFKEMDMLSNKIRKIFHGKQCVYTAKLVGGGGSVEFSAWRQSLEDSGNLRTFPG